MTQTLAKYGAHETNPLDKSLVPPVDAPKVEWTDSRLAKITRLRLLSDPNLPFWDVSYCYGVLKDGTRCRVELPFSQLPRSRNWKRTWAFLYDWGNKDGVRIDSVLNNAAISSLV